MDDDLTLVYMWAEKQTAKRYTAHIDELEHNLKLRDKFIIDKGLWNEFVAGLDIKRDNCGND
jgi:hypothetical protein